MLSMRRLLLAAVVAMVAAACTTVGATPEPIDMPTGDTRATTEITANTDPGPDTTTDAVSDPTGHAPEQPEGTTSPPPPSTATSNEPEPILIAPAAKNEVTVTATPTGPFFLGPGDVSQDVDFTGDAGPHSITWTVTLGGSTVASGSGTTYSFTFDLPGAEGQRLYTVTATPSNNGWTPGVVQILLTHASS